MVEVFLKTIQKIRDKTEEEEKYPNEISFDAILKEELDLLYEDYSVETINNLAELESINVNCPNFIDDTYSCVEFLYPISCYTYNSQSEQTGLVTMNNDLAWFEYLTYLSEDTFIAIDYDMTLLVNNEVISVSNNEELTAAFAQTDCEVNPSNSNPDVNALRDIMKDGTWYVSEFLNNGEDETSDYSGYNFDFRDSITVYSYGGSGVVATELGKALAEKFAKEGWKVAASARRKEILDDD